MISISLLYCRKKVFTQMNTSTIDKNLMKLLTNEKHDFSRHLNMKVFTDTNYRHDKINQLKIV